jgi:hypothetical protein
VPQVCYRHCYTSFPFPGATNRGTFTGAGQSIRRDRCPHSVSRPPSNRHPRMLVPQTDPSSRTSPLNPIFMLRGAPKAHEVYSETGVRRRSKGDSCEIGARSELALRQLRQTGRERRREPIAGAALLGNRLARLRCRPNRLRDPAPSARGESGDRSHRSSLPGLLFPPSRRPSRKLLPCYMRVGACGNRQWGIAPASRSRG